MTFPVVEAMPGTLTELAARTGLALDEVLDQIAAARAAGVRIRAVPDPTVSAVPVRARPGPGYLLTSFEVGQGLVEYALIFVLCVIFLILLLAFLGGRISGFLSDVGVSV